MGRCCIALVILEKQNNFVKIRKNKLFSLVEQVIRIDSQNSSALTLGKKGIDL